MDNRQKEAAVIRAMPRGIYHLCTDGWKEGRLFNTIEQFKMGMSTIALVALSFDVKILSFVLMPNHIHLLLNANGATCLEVFYFIRQRILSRLKQDGNIPLPQDYWMKLVSVCDRESTQNHYIYLARNTYEKDYCIPGAYPWGTDYLFFSRLSNFIRGTRADKMKNCDVRKILCSRLPLPPDWEIHPTLGVLPRNYVCLDIFSQLFNSPKSYMTRLVKEYESFVHLSQALCEEWSPSKSEIDDIVYGTMRNMFKGKRMDDLSPEEKGRLAVTLDRQYHFSTELLSQIISLPERVVRQFIQSKDYGYRESSGPSHR